MNIKANSTIFSTEHMDSALLNWLVLLKKNVGLGPEVIHYIYHFM